ncbi:MAG: hypothetical protein ACKV2V_19440, partial [Blastocatellia bacterium]
MNKIRLIRLCMPALAAVWYCLAPAAAQGDHRAASRAVAFLAREVPAWPARNSCFSCHNNGDAARALYVA